MVEDVETLSIGGHDAVLHAVVDHLDEVAGTAGAAMKVALFGGAAYFVPPGGAGNVADARGDGFEDGIQVFDSSGRAADHEAIASFETPDTAAGAHVDVLNALGSELGTAADVIDVIGIATVDEDVAGFQVGRELGYGLVHHGCRNHQPDGAWLGELGDHVRERGGPYGFLLFKILNRLRRAVEHHAGVTVVQQALDHVGAHSSQTDHS